MILLSLGCLSDLSTVWGESDPSYEEPGIDLVLLDCSDGSVTVEVWPTGNDVATVDVLVEADGASLSGALDPDYSGSTDHWSGALDGSCDRAWTATVTVNGACESTSDTATWEPPQLGGVFPTDGPETGGTRLAIAFEGDTEGVTVELGDLGWTTVAATSVTAGSGADCADVEGETCLLATTPAYGEPDTVDVIVTTSGGDVASLHDGFTFHADRTGEVVLFGRSKLIAFDDAWFWLGSPYTDIGESSQYVQIDMAFHEPLDESEHVFSHSAWPGECSGTDYSYDRVGAGTYIELDDEVLLMEDAEYYWFVDLDDPTGLAGYGYDVTLNESGTSTIAPQTIPDAFVVPQLLTSSSFGDPSQPDFVTGTQTTVRGEDLVLSWTADHDMDGLSWSIKAVEGYTELSGDGCTVDPDAGELTVPWSQLVANPDDDDRVDGFTVALEFWTDQQVVLPHDNSSTWTRSYLFLWTYIEVE